MTAYSDVPETAGSSVKVLKTAITDFRQKTIAITNDRLDRIKAKLLPAINTGETDTIARYVYSDAGAIKHALLA